VSPIKQRFAEIDRRELSNARDQIERFEAELKWWQEYAAKLQQQLDQYEAAA
jgi:hypothetical protein